MSAGQTAINPIGQPVAFAGLIADNGEQDLVSGFSEEESNPIPFGIAVKQGTAPAGALLMSSSGDYIKGITGFSFEHAPGTFGDIDATDAGIVPQGRLRVLRKGRIWVVIDQTIDSIAPFEDRAFIRYAAHSGGAPGGSQVGAFSNVTDASYNTDMTRIGIFTSGIQVAADGTNIAQVEVDFTNRPT